MAGFRVLTAILLLAAMPLDAKEQARLIQLVTVVQVAAFVFVLAGEQLLASLGYAHLFPRTFWHSVSEQKFAILAGAWFAGSMLQSSLGSTGAFEVYANGNQVFSKLAEGRMPTLPELLSGVAAELGLD